MFTDEAIFLLVVEKKTSVYVAFSDAPSFRRSSET